MNTEQGLTHYPKYSVCEGKLVLTKTPCVKSWFKWSRFGPVAPIYRFKHSLHLYFQAKQCLKDWGQCWLCDLALCSHHCGSWMLAPCQAKQSLIPSAGKARPPLSNPILGSLAVWSAHTALRPCVFSLGWKKILLVGTSHPAPVCRIFKNTHTHTPNEKAADRNRKK